MPLTFILFDTAAAWQQKFQKKMRERWSLKLFGMHAKKMRAKITKNCIK